MFAPDAAASLSRLALGAIFEIRLPSVRLLIWLFTSRSRRSSVFASAVTNSKISGGNFTFEMPRRDSSREISSISVRRPPQAGAAICTARRAGVPAGLRRSTRCYRSVPAIASAAPGMTIMCDQCEDCGWAPCPARRMRPTPPRTRRAAGGNRVRAFRCLVRMALAVRSSVISHKCGITTSAGQMVPEVRISGAVPIEPVRKARRVKSPRDDVRKKLGRHGRYSSGYLSLLRPDAIEHKYGVLDQPTGCSRVAPMLRLCPACHPRHHRHVKTIPVVSQAVSTNLRDLTV